MKEHLLGSALALISIGRLLRLLRSAATRCTAARRGRSGYTEDKARHDAPYDGERQKDK